MLTSKQFVVVAAFAAVNLVGCAVEPGDPAPETTEQSEDALFGGEGPPLPLPWWGAGTGPVCKRYTYGKCVNGRRSVKDCTGTISTTGSGECVNQVCTNYTETCTSQPIDWNPLPW